MLYKHRTIIGVIILLFIQSSKGNRRKDIMGSLLRRHERGLTDEQPVNNAHTLNPQVDLKLKNLKLNGKQLNAFDTEKMIFLVTRAAAHNIKFKQLIPRVSPEELSHMKREPNNEIIKIDKQAWIDKFRQNADLVKKFDDALKTLPLQKEINREFGYSP
ncbi:unnamed protein product [Didymodactylos carnosus]|uniref:Uncharacterized protein n=1 Tax=Didymodactylos carnosus TaxID=1234261 RepID=A0A814AUQ2_9BILA|nr:unnamed protein product [Didymodactylos carnosus]CAF1388402.1 unnamed protein product [Didymodactylos carnosus]CAF3697025.1 unnamed protein product [Didymodactylos carnosus]CAF4196212.1 unnamed protein product [Didymodactylos carnosus]